jgi:hypothetical protein
VSFFCPYGRWQPWYIYYALNAFIFSSFHSSVIVHIHIIVQNVSVSAAADQCPACKETTNVIQSAMGTATKTFNLVQNLFCQEAKQKTAFTELEILWHSAMEAGKALTTKSVICDALTHKCAAPRLKKPPTFTKCLTLNTHGIFFCRKDALINLFSTDKQLDCTTCELALQTALPVSLLITHNLTEMLINVGIMKSNHIISNINCIYSVIWGMPLLIWSINNM